MTKTEPYIYAPSGYAYYSRRLNRHSYHLTNAWTLGPTLCGNTEDVSVSNHTMDYLLGHDSYKRCEECLALAGVPEQVEEVKAAKIAHDEAEAAHAEQMRQALTKLHFPGRVEDLTPEQLRTELRCIENEAGAALRGIPF